MDVALSDRKVPIIKANYSSVFEMTLNDKITTSSQTIVSYALYRTLQTTKLNFEKLLG